MYNDEYEPDPSDPLIKKFYDIFGPGFGCEVPDGYVFYDNDKQLGCTPETKEQFFELIEKSIKCNKNLFINTPPTLSPTD